MSGPNSNTGSSGAHALVLYWSLTGTTLLVAERIAEGFRDANAACTVHNLRDGVPSDAGSYDAIGLGFPVHWYRPPTPVNESIAELGDLSGMPVFTFALNGTYRGAGLNRARRALVHAGGRDIGAFGCHGEGRFYPYARRGVGFSPGHPTKDDLDAAHEFGRRTAAALEVVRRGGALPDTTPFDPPTHPMYALERLVSGPRLTRLVYSRLFRALPDRCSRCGRCARACPVANIRWERGARPSWGRECVLCLNCVATCPEEAVSCPLDWKVFQPFIRWNVRRAWRDPDLEHTRVTFERGRFTQL